MEVHDQDIRLQPAGFGIGLVFIHGCGTICIEESICIVRDSGTGDAVEVVVIGGERVRDISNLFVLDH